MMQKPRIVTLIDGEHYLPVIREAINRVGELGTVEAAVFIGGTEKISENSDLDSLPVRVLFGEDSEMLLAQVIEEHNADLVIDLSDEPVVGYRERFRFANIALHGRASYSGADFHFEAPKYAEVLHKPSVAIIGTGKRVGKTAISAFICRVVDKETSLRPVVVAMGRGGPKCPDVIDGRSIRLDAQTLLAESRAGKHAASDYFEDALLSRITTIGCRRCGGGLAGVPFVSNVIAGAEIADKLDSGFIILEGSGAAIPPVKSDGCITVIGAHQPIEYIDGYFGPYRLMRSDIVVITMCEAPLADDVKLAALEATIKSINPDAVVIQTVFRPKPTEDVKGLRAFVATTTPAVMVPRISRHLEDRFGCEIVGISPHLSDRRLLKQDMAAAPAHDVVITEIKAAAIDVVTDVALTAGKRVVYYDNIPVTVKGGELAEEALTYVKRIVLDHA